MKPTVFVDRKLPESVHHYLEQHCIVQNWQPNEDRGPQQLLAHLQEAEGFFTSGYASINEELLLAAPKLRAVSTMSVGYNHFDLAAMKQSGVIGTHTPYVLDDTVADLVLGLMLSAGRKIATNDAYIKAGNWTGKEGKAFFGLDIHHRKLGIIGMGRIGEAVAKRAKFGFDMEVSYYNRNRKAAAEEKYGITYASLNDLLQQSDFVVLLAPLTKETERMLTLEQFSLMKSTAIFINVSRGQTIVEADLITALQQGIIAAAGLDVFEQEPLPADSPFLKLDNVVLSPHIGSATAATRDDMAMLAARNLVHTLQGSKDAFIVPELQS